MLKPNLIRDDDAQAGIAAIHEHEEDNDNDDL